MVKSKYIKQLRIIVALFLLFAGILFILTKKNVPVSANNLSLEQSNALQEVNEYRKENRLSELKWNSKLSEAAVLKLQDEDAGDYFDHVSPNGQKAWDFIAQCGYEYRYAGENLAMGYENEKAAFDAWLKSESHLENIVFEEYNDFGFASLKADIGGEEALLMVQIFGSQITILDRILSTI